MRHSSFVESSIVVMREHRRNEAILGTHEKVVTLWLQRELQVGVGWLSPPGEGIQQEYTGLYTWLADDGEGNLAGKHVMRRMSDSQEAEMRIGTP